MGLNYKKSDHGSQDSMWTSYSDLFLGLSIIFLLLYVAASLRQGTDGILQYMENQQLVKKNQDLQQQIKVYENLKQNYLQNQASNEEQATYEMLMDKLSLLQDQASEEKNSLRAQALENEAKEQALNKYQQLIRNIINSNMIAKSRIKNRDQMIDTKEEVISEQNVEIQTLEKNLVQKQQEVAQGEQRIAGLESELEKKLKNLRAAYRANQMSKKKFEQQQQMLEQDFASRISNLKELNAKASQQLASVSAQLNQTQSRLQSSEGALARADQEKEQLQKSLEQQKGQYASEVAALREQFEKQRNRNQRNFADALKKEQLSRKAREEKEASFRAEADRKAKQLEDQIAQLGKKYQVVKGDLAKATERLQAQRKLADQIRKNFAKNGVTADVDGESGDVILSFGDQYFDTGRAQLKPQMKKILEQAMPLYSQSLFADPKISEKIQSVEIVGFASPTFKGKFVDPASLKPEDRQAVNYNLDLSYNRARSIFNHVFDKDKMSFDHQERLLPLVKVTGRSFLAHEKNKTFQGAGKGEEFCRKNDCAKLQRVIIKFTLKD